MSAMIKESMTNNGRRGSTNAVGRSIDSAVAEAEKGL